MTLTNCKKCKKEISSTAKFCPYCGESNTIKYCRECGQSMPANGISCQNCGYTEKKNYYPNQTQYQETSKGEQYDLSIVALITSFIAPIVGLILGIIVTKANKGVKNSANTMGTIAILVSGIYLALSLVLVVIYFIFIATTFVLY